MNTNTRKLFSRIGAGLMLGLSLFNLGAAWQKGGGAELPQRARQIRKREQEQLRTETQTIAEVAEQEGKAIIAQQQTQEETEVQLSEQQLTPSQYAIRFTALAVWGVTASLFFASMLFNYPFAMGKAVLSLLPGVPHTSVLTLESDEAYYQAQGVIKVQVKLDSDGEAIQMVRAALAYDSEKMMFDHYEAAPGLFENVKKTPTKEGEVILTLEEAKQPSAYDKETIATIYFTPLAQGTTKVALQKESSTIVMIKEDKQLNVLGATASTNVRISPSDSVSLACQPLAEGAAQQEATWQDMVVGTLLPEEKNSWTTLDVQRAVQCHTDGTNMYLLFNGSAEDTPVVTLMNNGEKKILTAQQSTFRWTQDQRTFYVMSFSKTSLQQPTLTITMESESAFRWPAKGTAQLKFD